MEKKYYIALGLVVLCLGLYFFFFWKMLVKHSTCEQNPFVYGAQSFKEKGADLSCSCDVLQSNYKDFTFDKEGIKYIIVEYSGPEYEPINMSNFKNMIN